ncbi:MAG: flagellar protein [Zetaproteobacteria bacterium]|nr:MAG: flagellar protein [Zetaproteobacteria bacterium]
MALSVQTNNAAITALKNLNTNNRSLNISLNRLSSGFRINNAADDASGFAVSSKLNAQTGRLKAASDNVTQAVAMVKMADAGINEIQNMINRIQVLATQAASANTGTERAKLDAERVKLETAIDKIANSTQYNGISLLNGAGGATAGLSGTAATTAGVNATVTLNGANSGDSYTFSAVTATATSVTITGQDTTTSTTQSITVTIPSAGSTTTVDFTDLGLKLTVDSNLSGFAASAVTIGTGNSTFQVGSENGANNRIDVNLTNSYTTSALGLDGSVSGALSTQSSAQAYITTATNALDTLITQRADLGATQNQLSFVQANLATSIEQTTAAVSAIRDADMASEMANFTKNQILTQAGISMLAQANQAAQNILSLFR